MWETRVSIVDWVYSKTQTLQATLKIRKPTLVKHLMHFRKSSICSHKMDVQEANISLSHSSTESEVISLDAGLRLDGIPAFDLWDVVIEALHSSKNTHQAVRAHC